MRRSLQRALVFTLACGPACMAAQSIAQPYPSKSIRMIVGSSAGGGGDTLARLVSQELTAQFRQQVIVDNRPGAGGNIGADLVAKAPPDGYTILFAFSGHVYNPSLYSKLPFDTVRDFAPITMLARNESVLIVHPSVPAKSVQELIAIAKKNPGKYTIGALPSSAQALGAELFKLKAGIDLLFVPYKGNGPALVDVVGGQLDTMFNTLAISLSLVQSGKLRALAVAGEHRSKLAPDLPTVSEAGLPGFSFVGWYGIVAPAGTPHAVVRRLNEALVQVVKSPDMTQRILNQGNEPVGSTPEEFDRFIREEIPKWAKVIKDARITLAP